MKISFVYIKYIKFNIYFQHKIITKTNPIFINNHNFISLFILLIYKIYIMPLFILFNFKAILFKLAISKYNWEIFKKN